MALQIMSYCLQLFLAMNHIKTMPLNTSAYKICFFTSRQGFLEKRKKNIYLLFSLQLYLYGSIFAFYRSGSAMPTDSSSCEFTDVLQVQQLRSTRQITLTFYIKSKNLTEADLRQLIPIHHELSLLYISATHSF